MSIASTLDKQGGLAASFFWDITQKGTGLDSIEHFPSTLARQLALFNADYENLLVRHLRQQPSPKDVPGSTLKKQMEAWVIDPMRELEQLLSLSEEHFIIVLDGLNECGDQEALQSLMELVLSLAELPDPFAIFVGCRPESPVVSAWTEARNRGLVIPCQDVDLIPEAEKFHTLRRMVEDGLRDSINGSSWKPSKEDLDGFTSACRGLPVIASIRVRDVDLSTRRGETLRSEFEYFRNLIDPPVNVMSEHLRILRRAYMVGSSGVRLSIAKKYREVVGTMVAAHEPLSVQDMAHLLSVAEAEIYAILQPISSMAILPLQSTENLKFRDAMVKEFITGDPIGNANDRVFFISDVKGYFLGLPLLRVFNDSCDRNTLGIPTEPPLGDRMKWRDFWPSSQLRSYFVYPHLKYLTYAANFLLGHLDPSELFSQESNELQQEFNSFLTRNLHVFTLLMTRPFEVPQEWLQSEVSHAYHIYLNNIMSHLTAF
ncbi:uncharacterized protein EI90DRAFT_1765050 [Cantharellus anzutake]|uniref:uncharacterized protein n=1 Tax=Cantharellus anzutake TaxID=1750568 RepID=UPI001908F0F5|nr:uncharacterized protein EI90DRAFT_1765050 [Cantharellus anzutake]KAF8327545.1 hypothetical protein EI90DRAFT_1765050 [Cantharellus anzutake]